MANEMMIPKDFNDKIKQHLQDAIIQLIPSEKWDEMIKAQVDNFIKSDLPRLVNELARDKFKSIIKHELDSPKWNATYNKQGQRVASEAVVDLLKNNGNEILRGLFGGIIQDIAQQLKNQLY